MVLYAAGAERARRLEHSIEWGLGWCAVRAVRYTPEFRSALHHAHSVFDEDIFAAAFAIFFCSGVMVRSLRSLPGSVRFGCKLENADWGSSTVAYLGGGSADSPQDGGSRSKPAFVDDEEPPSC